MKHDWITIQERADSIEEPVESISQLARLLEIPRRTVADALSRGILVFDFTTAEEDQAEVVSFVEDNNEAFLKFNSAQPLNALEAAKVGGVDLDVWKIEKQRVNMWQVGRKDKKVNIEYSNGMANGSIEDHGGFNKTYLYQIEVKFTRRDRIPVSIVMQPVVIETVPPLRYEAKEENLSDESVLFICDPHFGYKGRVPFHNRQFISDLLSIQRIIKPKHTVWNGDALDLAEFGSFPNDPAITQKTQAAAVEFAWVLNQFRPTEWDGDQILIEGNHEARLRKAIIKNLSAGYDLRPVHDLTGDSMLSVPRLLGLKELGVSWIGDYPNGYFQYGNARFIHGVVAAPTSGSTVSSLISKTAISTFFGHIHRYELASRRIDGIDGMVWAGSPGCATSLSITPGVTRVSNWSQGAFLVSFDGPHVVNVEHIFHESGNTYFRGVAVKATNYFDTGQFVRDIADRFGL